VKKLYTFKYRNPKLYVELVPSALRNPLLQDVLTVLPLRNQFGRRMFLVEAGKFSELLGFEPGPSSDILKTRKHNVSETGSVSVLRCGGRQQQGRCLLPHLRTETASN
jgi:hypothetical protein